MARPRTLRRIALLARLNRVVRAVAPSAGVGSVMDAHLGGLALERLIRCGRVQYRFIFARRPPLQVS
jgi:hypothetical protein